jgi:hypothetical protein
MKKLTNELAGVLSTFMSSAEVKDVVDRTRAATAEDTGSFRMVITTENLDRYQEVISIDGWELDHYLSNPVVLWGHDHFTPPVAVTEQLIKEDGKLIAIGRFAPTDMGQMLRKLYDLGILRASSVGFIEKERQGNLITRAELIEWSFVSVPANPYALGLAFEKGLSLDELVTKGFLNMKTAEETETVPEDDAGKEAEAPESEAEEEEAAPEVEVKAFDTKTLSPIVAQLRAALGALEALGNEEPERTEDEPGDEEAEEERQLREFNEQRRTIQLAATIIGDILAEKRQEARSILNK